MCVSLDSFKKFIEAKKSEVTQQMNVSSDMQDVMDTYSQLDSEVKDIASGFG